MNDKLTAQVQALVVKITETQEEYHRRNNRYFQGLRNPTGASSDGILKRSLNMQLKPTDAMDTWDVFTKLSAGWEVTLPFTITVDVYSGPRGDGWIVSFEVTRDGKKHVYREIYGLEDTHLIQKQWVVETDGAHGE